MYLDPDVAALHVAYGAPVATDLTIDLRQMVTNMTEKVFTSESQRGLIAEALDDLAQNRGRQGHCCVQ